MSVYFRDKSYGSSVRKYTKNGHKPLSDIGVLRELRTLESQLAEARSELRSCKILITKAENLFTDVRWNTDSEDYVNGVAIKALKKIERYRDRLKAQNDE